MDEVIYLSASETARAIRQRDISSQEVVNAYLKWIEEVNPKLNAVVQLVEERALAEAREADEALTRDAAKGALHGVPITIKDSLDIEGIISTGGTTGRKSFVPDKDATVVARLRAAGAILLGKTNTPELTLDGETNNLIYGKTNNPYDLERTPGGSSGGAAAIVASGGSPLDIGSDTGGSIRGPAHDCGITGIKPNSGRVPRTGHIIPYGMGALDSLTQLGPLARKVEDLIMVLPIISGPDGKDPAIVPMPLGTPSSVELKGLKVAVHSDNGIVSPPADICAAVENAAEALMEVGCEVTEEVPTVLKQTSELYERLDSADGRAYVKRLLDKAGTVKVSTVIEGLLKRSNAVSSADFSELMEEVDEYRSIMLQFMSRYDVILCPGGSHPALPHGYTYKEEYRDFSHTSAYNLTGWPGVVVRGGTSVDGMPVGVQVVARPWREDVALAVAQHLETELGGWQRPDL